MYISQIISLNEIKEGKKAFISVQCWANNAVALLRFTSLYWEIYDVVV